MATLQSTTINGTLDGMTNFAGMMPKGTVCRISATAFHTAATADPCRAEQSQGSPQRENRAQNRA